MTVPLGRDRPTPVVGLLLAQWPTHFESGRSQISSRNAEFGGRGRCWITRRSWGTPAERPHFTSATVRDRPGAVARGAPVRSLKSIEAAVEVAAARHLNVIRLDACFRGRGSRRPEARRCGTCPMPGRVTSIPTPSRHPSTGSINASLGNPNGDRRLRATPDRCVPAAAGARCDLPDARETPAFNAPRDPQRPLITPASRRPGPVGGVLRCPRRRDRGLGFTIPARPVRPDLRRRPLRCVKDRVNPVIRCHAARVLELEFYPSRPKSQARGGLLRFGATHSRRRSRGSPRAQRPFLAGPGGPGALGAGPAWPNGR